MKNLLLLCLPVVLFAQVEVETVIPLPDYLLKGFFLAEHNKLYIHTGGSRFLIVDCSTYSLKATVPSGSGQGVARYHWAPAHRKVYLTDGWPDTCKVVDPDADTVVNRFHMPGDATFIPTVDRLYVGSWDGTRDLLGIDCAADTVATRIPMPVPGYSFGLPLWDSAGGKIYCPVVQFSRTPLLPVYMLANESLMTIVDPRRALAAIGINYTYRKLYCTGPTFIVIDTKRDSIIKRLDVNGGPMALNYRDDKVYVVGNAMSPTAPDTLYVIDCDKDSVVRKVLYGSRATWPAECLVWVPWSNRIYFTNMRDTLWVLDCETDSIIARLRLGLYAPLDIQLDPIRERIFAIGADTLAVHVLRDVPCGAVEERPTKPVTALPLRVSPSPARDRVWLEGADKAALFAPDGRRAAILSRGANDVRHLSRGVYFCRSPDRRESVRIVLVE